MKQNVNLKCAKLGKRAGGSYGIVFKRYFNCPYYYSKFFISCKIILVFLLKKIKQYILNKIKKKNLKVIYMYAHNYKFQSVPAFFYCMVS